MRKIHLNVPTFKDWKYTVLCGKYILKYKLYCYRHLRHMYPLVFHGDLFLKHAKGSGTFQIGHLDGMILQHPLLFP
jgi:hypothetical protein